MMRLRHLLTPSLLLLLFSTQALGFSAIDSGLEKENPSQLMLVVAPFNEEQRALGLSEEQVAYQVSAHLKAHSIYVPKEPEDTHMFLYIKIHTLGKDFYVLDVGLHRGVMYIEMDTAFQSLVATWSVLALGSVDPEAKTSTRINAILDHLDQVLDRFITDYLAVNKTRMNLN